MPPRRNPRRPAAAAAAAAASKKDSTATPRTYESTPVPQQITFPPRRKVVRTYGRRSLPARLETATTTTTPGSENNVRRSLRQQTLTQIDYVRSSSSLSGEGGGDLLLPEEGEEDDGKEEKEKVDSLMEEEEGEGMQVKGGVRGGIKRRAKGGKQGGKKELGGEDEMEVEMVKVAAKRKISERTSKRRKTMGDVPTPNLERKGSSFHTQTLTQFLGASTSRLRESGDDGLRVEDEDEVEDLPLPGGTPVKRPARLNKGKGKAVAPDPHTPSNKRIKVRLDEIPSSQPSPDTPWRGHSPLKPIRSPLTQKSTNVDAPLPTIETVSKLPRTLVIQDSYNMGSSQGLSSSAAGETPKKEQTPSQKSNRVPLTELPVASLDLGIGSTPTGETPSTRKKRMFIEIPDSDDELESIGSTPFRTRSTQQTPLKREEVAEENFEIAADPGSGSRAGRAAVTETPASLGKSDKENESPAVKVWDDEETASEGGTPTPTQARKSQTAGRASQVSPNTASQFWTASAENIGGTGASGALREPLAELVVVEEPTATEEPMDTEERPGTPTPAPRASQFHGSMGGSDGKIRQATPQMEDADETASEAEEEQVPRLPTSILRKATSQKAPGTDSGKRRSTPEPITSDLSTGGAPGTPTPIARRVQIELPPSSAEEVYKETPRKPHKSSPIYQRHTQARSQFYSQGLESQRVPLEVIRSLGPQTDRSDIVITIHPKSVEDIANGARDHEFRSYKFPIQVARCWICTDLPVGELKYMATLGSAQEPGQIDSGTGLGNAEFNAGTSGYKFAHKLLQVYQLNNPIPLADMEDNGLGDGPPQRYKYIPPAIVGQLMANLRCPLFAEGDDEHEEDDNDDHEGGVTISQELEDQLRSDIIHSTQKLSRQGWRHHEEEEEDIIPASQSPAKQRSATAQKADESFARPPVPPRASQRLRSQHRSQPYPQPQQPGGGGGKSSLSLSSSSRTPKNHIRPSQATTASDISSSSAVSSPAKSSVPRPPMPESGELSLPDLPGDGDDDDDDGDDDDGEGSSLLLSRRRGLLLPLPLPLPSSSQAAAGVLPPDSLLVDEGRMAPPPVEVWDSDDDEEEEGY